jgi:hypothetical protein
MTFFPRAKILHPWPQQRFAGLVVASIALRDNHDRDGEYRVGRCIARALLQPVGDGTDRRRSGPGDTLRIPSAQHARVMEA